jgi:hypothetical protein
MAGDYTAQGIELDFNNNNAHRGEADAGQGLAPPSSYGLSVTGAGRFRSTSALLVCGNGGPDSAGIWNRGITFANNAIIQSTFQDLTNAQKSIDIRGNPGYGVYQSSDKSKNWFNGDTVLGAGAAGAGGYKLTVHGKAVSSGGWVQGDARDVAEGPGGLSDVGGADTDRWARELGRLRPRAFRFGGNAFGGNAEGGEGESEAEGKGGTERELGLVAQEVEAVFPELVRTDGAGRKAVSYERLALVLLEALKAQQARVGQLERQAGAERVERRAEQGAMERRLAALERALAGQ